MGQMHVSLNSLPQTGAAVGWASGHTVVIDRAEGRAGGTGLGFNGGEMLALALGGCLCNALRYMAETLATPLGPINVEVTLDLEGDPLLVVGALLTVDCALADGGEASAVIEAAIADSTVSNSVQRGIPVRFARR